MNWLNNVFNIFTPVVQIVTNVVKTIFTNTTPQGSEVTPPELSVSAASKPDSLEILREQRHSERKNYQAEMDRRSKLFNAATQNTVIIPAEMLVKLCDNRLGKCVLTAIRVEGIPEGVPQNDFLKRFARMGNDEHETLEVKRELSSFVKNLHRQEEHLELSLETFNPDISYSENAQQTLASLAIQRLKEDENDPLAQRVILFCNYGVNLISTRIYDENHKPETCLIEGIDWCKEGINNVYKSVTLIADALWKTRGDLASYVSAKDAAQLFYMVMGDVEIELNNSKQFSEEKWSAQVFAHRDVSGKTYNTIQVYTHAFSNQQNKDWFVYNLIHEFGHVLNNRVQRSAQNAVGRGIRFADPIDDNDKWMGEKINLNEFPNDGWIPFTEGYSGLMRQNKYDDESEVWADMFLFWVYNGFTDNDPGRGRRDWMQQIMPNIVNKAYIRSVDIFTLIQREPVTGNLNTNVNYERGYLNFRPKANLNSVPFMSIPPYSNVKIIGQSSNKQWVAVQYGTEIGWVSKDYISFSGDIKEIKQECLDWLVGNSSADENPCF